MCGQPLGIPNPATSDEIEEGRPWWKVCCAGCCLGVLALAALAFGGLSLATGPGPERVSSLPESFPAALTLFRPEEAREIIYYPASSKNRLARIVLAPIGWLSGFMRRAPSRWPFNGSATSSPAEESLQTAVAAQVSKFSNADTVAVRWNKLDATTGDIVKFYAGSLIQAGVGTPRLRRDENAGLVELAGSGPALNFSLLLMDDFKLPGIDSLTIIVEYPSSKNP